MVPSGGRPRPHLPRRQRRPQLRGLWLSARQLLLRHMRGLGRSGSARRRPLLSSGWPCKHGAPAAFSARNRPAPQGTLKIQTQRHDAQRTTSAGHLHPDAFAVCRAVDNAQPLARCEREVVLQDLDKLFRRSLPLARALHPRFGLSIRRTFYASTERWQLEVDQIGAVQTETLGDIFGTQRLHHRRELDRADPSLILDCLDQGDELNLLIFPELRLQGPHQKHRTSQRLDRILGTLDLSALVDVSCALPFLLRLILLLCWRQVVIGLRGFDCQLLLWHGSSLFFLLCRQRTMVKAAVPLVAAPMFCEFKARLFTELNRDRILAVRLLFCCSSRFFLLCCHGTMGEAAVLLLVATPIVGELKARLLGAFRRGHILGIHLFFYGPSLFFLLSSQGTMGQAAALLIAIPLFGELIARLLAAFKRYHVRAIHLEALCSTPHAQRRHGAHEVLPCDPCMLLDSSDEVVGLSDSPEKSRLEFLHKKNSIAQCLDCFGITL
mmetsp:Transcript_57812/g.187853  ORF Transcript_57812/g.187853 Transcript_57812/m.187853 type:complete len:494 (-) Transcript_57812:691-2172(-)